MNRILIIEDDEDLREGLAFSLEMDGCETACAGTKREGMEQLKKLQKDGVAGEDEVQAAEKELDKVTKTYVEQIDEVVTKKEAELMEV